MTKAWTTDDGLPSNGVHALAQTKDGYLWVGTTGGLARFDGMRFVTYGEKEGIPLIPIRKLVALPDGRLWILNAALGSYWLENGRFVKDARRILEIEIGKDGKVYAYDGKVIFTLGEVSAGGIKIAAPELLEQPRAEMAVTKDGTVWLFQVSFKSCKVWVWKNNSWKEWLGYTAEVDSRRGPVAGNDSILMGLYSLQSGESGSVWFAEHAGKVITIHEDGTEKWISLPGNNPGTNAVAEDREGAIWVARHDGTLHYIKNGILTSHPLTTSRHAIRALAFGRDGEIWAGTETGGLLRNQVCSVKHRQKDLPLIKVAALALDKTGDVLVGTSGEGLFRWRADGTVMDVLGAEDKGRHITSILPDAANMLWIGGSWGLHCYRDGKRLTTESLARKLAEPDDFVTCLLQAKDASIWLGSHSGTLKVMKGDQVEEIPLKNKMTISHLAMDASGNIWATLQQDKIVVVEQGRTYFYLGKEHGVPEATLTGLYLDSHQIMWLGTEGNGLYFWRDGRFHRVETPEEKELGHALQIEEDDEGWIWVGTTHGICGVDVSQIRQGGTAASELLWLGAEDGMANEQCTHMEAAKDDSGNLHFGTMQGFVSFNPLQIKRPSLRLKVVIEQIKVENKPPTLVSEKNERHEMPPGGRFAIHFTGLPPEEAERMRFRYRLSGLESQWVDLGSRRFVDFSSTPHGDYRFEVQVGSRGKWTAAAAALDLHVRPHFWQTWTFKLVMATLGLAGVILVMKALERRRMRNVLAEIERTRAINQERDRIARDLHDGIGAGLTQVNLLMEEWGGKNETGQAVRLRERLRSLARELDSAVWVTNPSYDRLPAVCDYLAAYAQNWFKGTPIRCYLDLPERIPEVQMSSDVRHHLFQAVKECLNNVLKHSAATRVFVELQAVEMSFCLTIRDDGRGFNITEAARKGRHGLKNIQHRLNQINGTVEVQSSPQGTITKLVWPLPAP